MLKRKKKGTGGINFKVLKVWIPNREMAPACKPSGTREEGGVFSTVRLANLDPVKGVELCYPTRIKLDIREGGIGQRTGGQRTIHQESGGGGVFCTNTGSMIPVGQINVIEGDKRQI